MSKRVSTRRIKANRHYPYDIAADLLGITPQTLRTWRKAGLRVMTDTRPHLILGEDLIAFIEVHQKPPAKMAPDEFKCLTCKRPTRPLERLVFYTPLTKHRGQLEAVCEVCEGQCFRFAGETSLTKTAQFLEIVRNNPSQG
jgi:hypothetical protein